MIRSRRVAVTVPVLFLASLSVWAEGPISPRTLSGAGECSDAFESPTLTTCFSQSLAYGGGERGSLAAIACVVDRINEWKIKRLRCLEEAMAARQATVLWPWKALEAIGVGLRSVDTLREEVERLACDWHFTRRTAQFRDLYRRPLKLCRDSFQVLWGSHEGFYDADRQELLDWTSTVTHNMIEDRTIHEYGTAGEPPEETWRWIGAESGKVLGSPGASPGQAARLGAQLQADELRTNSNTIQLAAQTILVQQQARDLKALAARRERALAQHLVSLLADVDGRVPPKPVF